MKLLQSLFFLHAKSVLSPFRASHDLSLLLFVQHATALSNYFSVESFTYFTSASFSLFSRDGCHTTEGHVTLPDQLSALSARPPVRGTIFICRYLPQAAAGGSLSLQ